MKLIIYNRANAGMSKAKKEIPLMRISPIGQFLLNRETLSMMKLTEQNNRIEVCFDETESMWYLVNALTENGFESRPKGGGLPYEAGCVFQSLKIKNEIFDQAKLEAGYSYSFLVSQTPTEYAAYPGTMFWPIITSSAVKIINRKAKNHA